MATMQVTSKGQRALASTRPVPSHRVVPFKPVSQPRPCNRTATVVRAVEAPEAAEDLDFSFSYSDAKKNNEYTDNDVQQALRYAQDGEGSQPIWDSDFVRNPYGMEDASFFDDIDNNEAYDADEYVIAGIPEAAPKKRGRGRREGAAADDGDDLEQAKALDKVKAMEDRMVLEAALEEEFGDASRSEGAADSAPSKLAVWDWLTDFSSDAVSAEETQGLSEARQVTLRRSSATLVGENEVAGDIARAKPEMFEDTDTQAYLELFANDDLSEDVLAAADAADAESDDMPVSSITDEELARLDQLISEPLPIVDISDDRDVSVPRLDDSPELDKAVVDQYVESLRAAAANEETMSEEDVRAMFGSEPLTFEAADEEDAASKEEATQLLSAAEPRIQSLNVDLEAQAAEVEDTTAEPAEDEDGGLGRELQSLNAIEAFTEQDVPSDEMIKALQAYVDAAEDYVSKEELRKAEVAAAVARGELSVDALAEDLEEVSDATDELLADASAFDDEGENDAIAYDDEDDKETWVERIIELTRVTKVVKGGKIMGFRCVAIVGNQNGLVGVGCQAGREVAVAVKRTLVDAKKNIVRVPLVGAGTIPHRSEAKYHAARCVVLPASDGTGCIAGGSVRSVLELAGVKNCLAKRLGSRSALNSARATVKALQQLQSLNEVSRSRGVPMEQLLLQ